VKHAVEMGSGAMVLHTKEDTQTHRQQGDPISLLLFFQNGENWLKMRRTKKSIIVKVRERFLADTSPLHHVLS
jgi:hypothetical protein